jgi:hypothetical protein
MSKKEFTLPKLKERKNGEFSASNADIQYDLLGIEEWLNHMIAAGWKPVRVKWGTRYYFVPTEPGSHIARTVSAVTRNGFFQKSKAEELTEKLEAQGATLVSQESNWGSKIGLIALRPAELGPFELYRDLDSRIEEFKARKKYNEGSAIAMFSIAIISVITGALSHGNQIALSVIWFVLAGAVYAPVPRYKEIIKQLEAERDSGEA